MPFASTQHTTVQTRVNTFVRSVYNCMAVGLGLTGLIAYYTANTPALANLVYGNQLVFFG